MDVVHLALILDPAHEIRKGADVFLTSTSKNTKSVAVIRRHKRASLESIGIQPLKTMIFDMICV